MTNFILRILLRIARKVAIKKLEDFIVELTIKYAKGKFDYLLTPPQVPDIEEFPEITISVGREEGDDDIKKAVAAAGAGIGVGIALMASAGDKVSNSDISAGISDLDGATEDWNESGLLASLAVMGKDSLSSVADSIKEFEFNLPDFEFTPLPPYQRIFLDEKTEKIITRPDEGAESASSASFTGPITQAKRRRVFGKQKKITPKGKPLTNKEYAIYHEQYYTMEYLRKYYRVAQPSQNLDLLGSYQYDRTQQSIGIPGRMRKIKEIIIHCTSEPPTAKRDIEYYRQLHVRDNGWIDIGYNYIIFQDGRIESGRPLYMSGSHCNTPPYHNTVSIGISYVGGEPSTGVYKDTRTEAQIKSIWNLVFYLKRYFPSATVWGHHDFQPAKACPCFDVREEYNSILNGTYGKKNILAGGYAETSFKSVDDILTQKSDRNIVKTNGG